MIILKKPARFEWDEGNHDKNWLKHQVTFKEAEEVFGNQPLLLLADEKHSKKENRYFALGKTDQDRWLLLVFTVRRERVRIISARPMNQRERSTYKDHHKEKPI